MFLGIKNLFNYLLDPLLLRLDDPSSLSRCLCRRLPPTLCDLRLRRPCLYARRRLIDDEEVELVKEVALDEPRLRLDQDEERDRDRIDDDAVEYDDDLVDVVDVDHDRLRRLRRLSTVSCLLTLDEEAVLTTPGLLLL